MTTAPDRGATALPPQTEEQRAVVLDHMRRLAARPAFAVLDGRYLCPRFACGCGGIPIRPREVEWPKY